VPGSEYTISLDTLIVAIGEQPDIEGLDSMGIEIDRRGTLVADPETCATSREGVFAGGDVATGPNTVVEALAVGMRAAAMIHRYLRGEELRQPYAPALPGAYIDPAEVSPEELQFAQRAKPPTLPMEARRQNCAEVEGALSAEEATREALRCMRCDLEFTMQKADQGALESVDVR
jgi:NADPH-dependent glutamate synthase beta subunit-like oxidoreductase